MKSLGRHRQSGAIIEISQVETVRTVGLQIDKMIKNLVDVFRLAIRRQSHDLVFAGVDLEAGVIGKRGIQQTNRMRKVDLAGDVQSIAVTDTGRGCRPFADPVERQNGGFLERRRKERRSSVALMVVGEQ